VSALGQSVPSGVFLRTVEKLLFIDNNSVIEDKVIAPARIVGFFDGSGSELLSLL
jgi:hypothetical protein